MSKITAYSVREKGKRERMEDFALDDQFTTAGGLNLQVAMVCDGVGGGETGERASYLAATSVVAYMKSSFQQNIPELIIEAISDANRRVFDELHGEGYTTIALIVINLQDGLFGRLYTGSVGDSRIYLIREDENKMLKMSRLNMDHTVAGEAVARGEMSEAEARLLQNGHKLTRALGRDPEVEVDIGRYVERGKTTVTPRRAHALGRQGTELREGDTIFASSDGIFEINYEDPEQRPFVHTEELLAHAVDKDVKNAAELLIGYGSMRGPNDNISLSLVFVDSPKRKVVRPQRSMSPRTRRVLGGITAIVAFIGVILTLNVIRSRAVVDEQAILLTNQAVQLATQAAAIAITDTPLPTLAPTATFTPLPTLTPSPMPTVRVTPLPNEIGLIDSLGGSSSAIVEDRLVSAAAPSIIVLDDGGKINTSAYLYTGENTSFTVTEIDTDVGEEELSLLLSSGSQMLIRGGGFVTRGVEIRLQPRQDIQLLANAECTSVGFVDADVVSFACYGAQADISDCSYTLSSGVSTPLNNNSYVLIDLNTGNLADVPQPLTPDLAINYYQILNQLSVPLSDVSCVQRIVDQDNDNVVIGDECPEEERPADSPHVNGCLDEDLDGVPNYLDNCPQTRGDLPNGCLRDDDRDGIPNVQDRCPAIPGDRQGQGCPVDSDGDGVIDSEDSCPSQFGQRENSGCPAPDTDLDLVPDSIDRCPNNFGTIDNNGCPVGS